MRGNYKIQIERLFYLLILSTLAGLFTVLSIQLETWRTVATAILLIYLLYFVIKVKSKRKISNCVRRYIFLYCIIIALETHLSIDRYGYSFAEIMFPLRGFLWVLMLFPLNTICKKQCSLDVLLNDVIKIGMISIVLRTFSWIIYTIFNFAIFPDLLFELTNGVAAWTRAGTLRLGASCLWPIIIIGSEYMYNKNGKRRYIYTILIVIIYLAIVTKSRTYLLQSIIYLVPFVYWLISKRISSKSRFLFLLFTVVVGIGLILLIAPFILSYLGLDSGIMGLEYRYWELKYYTSLIDNTNILTGIGILSGYNSLSRAILNGPYQTQMFLDDLGYIQSYVQFGLMTVALYGGLIICVISAAIKSLKTKSYNNLVVSSALLLYVVVGSLTHDIFDVNKAITVPIILSICSFLIDISGGRQINNILIHSSKN
ncbi:hypothetical protein [Butyrivibrio sp. AE2015]|uniref:hypothetical protein n=1 Tax=Butyrivibrio sp. AE2015 TaxID=1280663 RepID=UPI0003B58C7A|nr:hypothetical protein [Butyrivibrio sp. AE2015]